MENAYNVIFLTVPPVLSMVNVMIVTTDMLLLQMIRVNQYVMTAVKSVKDLESVGNVFQDIPTIMVYVSNVTNLIAIYVKKPISVSIVKMIIYQKTVYVSQFVKMPVLTVFPQENVLAVNQDILSQLMDNATIVMEFRTV